MMRYILWVICTMVYISVAGCVNRQSGTKTGTIEEDSPISFPHKIDISGSMDHFSDIRLSDIVEDIEYVPLEFTKDCPIGGSVHPVVTNEYIIVFTGRIYLFSRTGKFIREIGRPGKGPEEYGVRLGYVDVDIPNRLIYVSNFTGNRIVKYSFNGDHAGNIRINLVDAGKVSVIDSTAVFAHFALAWPMLSAYVLGWGVSQHGDTLYTRKSYAAPNIKKYPSFREASRIKQISLTDNQVYKFENKSIFCELINDTLSTITPQGFEPRYILNLGQYKCPPEISHGLSNFSEAVGKARSYMIFFGFSETGRFLRFDFQYDKRYCIGFYDKTNRETRIWASEKGNDLEEWFYFPEEYMVNDIDGGSNNHLPLDGARAVHVDELMEDLTPGHFAGMRGKVKHPEKMEALQKLVNGLTENDNPVVMIYHFKK